MNAPCQDISDLSNDLVHVSSELAARVDAFCSASNLRQRNAALIRLTRWVRPENPGGPGDQTLQALVRYLESNLDVRLRFQASAAALLGELKSLSLFAEAGIPSDHSFLSEVSQRLAAKLLPSAREEPD